MNKRNPFIHSLFPGMAISVMVLMMGGCSVSLLPEKQPQRQFNLPYHFEAESSAETPVNSMPVLKVNRPEAGGVLGGKRIVIETAPDELAAYGTVRWVSAAPELLRDHLVRALRQDPRLDTIVSDTSGSASGVTLSSSLLAFQEDRTGPQPEVRLYLQAQLMENGSRQLLGTRDFEVTVPVLELEIEGSVAAFGRAADRLSAEVADWLQERLPTY